MELRMELRMELDLWIELRLYLNWDWGRARGWGRARAGDTGADGGGGGDRAWTRAWAGGRAGPQRCPSPPCPYGSERGEKVGWYLLWVLPVDVGAVHEGPLHTSHIVLLASTEQVLGCCRHRGEALRGGRSA